METNNNSHRCIISFADESSWYHRGHNRLKAACEKHFSGKLLLINSYGKIGSPSHAENPYAFKVYCIEYARKLGYSTILYIDSSLYPIKNCDAMFDYMEENGHLMQKAGHMFRTWTNNRCREYFNVTDEEMQNVELYSAGFTGLDFTHPRSVEFFEKWKASCDAGIFKGPWHKKDITYKASDFTNCPNHEGFRHDMSCASIIATRLGMNFEAERYMAYIGQGYNQAPPETYFYCHPC